MAGSPCIECRSRNTELVDGDDGHFRKVCHDCDHVGGPYTSDQITHDEEQSESGQASLTEFT